MPWRETAPMAERMRFVTDWERDLYSMVELCERYGVSRKTGYKWLARYEADGPDGLRERSRAPHQSMTGDAAAIGLIASLARPGGNVTGISEEGTKLSAKRLEILRGTGPQG